MFFCKVPSSKDITQEAMARELALGAQAQCHHKRPHKKEREREKKRSPTQVPGLARRHFFCSKRFEGTRKAEPFLGSKSL